MITQRHIDMIDHRSFDKLFEREIPNHDTYEEAFNQLNREYREAFGRDRYSSYESYRKSRSKRVKSVASQ